jgi:phosphoribosylanthranilate isomerase
MYVKICGLRDTTMAAHSVAAGADALGVVMSPRSPRHATPAQAAEVIAAARASDREIDVALVVNRMPALEAAETARDLGFDVLQLHGSYAAADFAAAREILPRVWRATSLAQHPGLRSGEFGEERLLVDGAFPGSGEAWDLSLIDGERLGRGWLLAGGLDPDHVADAIAASRPAGVDVSSGVERAPGEKDPELITRFIRAARA